LLHGSSGGGGGGGGGMSVTTHTSDATSYSTGMVQGRMSCVGDRQTPPTIYGASGELYRASGAF
jgi:hypothetical protein